jgi:hypothetical protein
MWYSDAIDALTCHSIPERVPQNRPSVSAFFVNCAVSADAFAFLYRTLPDTNGDSRAFGVIRGTFGVIQGTFGVIQGTFGVIQGAIEGGLHNSARGDIWREYSLEYSLECSLECSLELCMNDPKTYI